MASTGFKRDAFIAGYMTAMRERIKRKITGGKTVLKLVTANQWGSARMPAKENPFVTKLKSRP
jgi:hypothetical protein